MTNAQIMALLNPAIAAVFALTFLVIWTRQKDRFHILAMAFAYTMLGTGFFISHLLRDWNLASGIVDNTGCFALGTTALVWAACKRAKQWVSIPLLLAIGLLGTLAAMAMQLTSGTMNGQLYATNAAYGTMFAIGTFKLARARKYGCVELLVFWMFALTTVQFWVRPAVSLYFEGSVNPTAYRESIYFAVLNATVALLSLLLALSLIAACVSDMMRQIRDASNTDLLSGLNTRRAFDEEAVKMLAKAERTPLPISMVITDIDHFKRVNDTYGHQVGDSVIAAFGQLIGDSARKSDLAGRLGGEEFCVLLWNSDRSGAVMFAEALRTEFSNLPFKGMAGAERMTASFGVAQLEPGETFDDLYARADKALYAAKHGGRDQVVTDGEPAVKCGDAPKLKLVG